MDDPQIETFVKNLINQEVIPTLSLDKEQLVQFADEVLKRFRNPFIKHELMSISLNSLTKFKTRLLPQLLTYSQRFNKPPKYISFSLAALIAFYRGQYQGQAIPLTDDAHLLEKFKEWQPLYQNDVKTLVSNVLKMTDHWGQDLNNVTGLTDLVTKNLENILAQDIKNYIPNN